MTQMKKYDYPIDIVIPWVDGSDKNWQAEYVKYSECKTDSVHSFDYKDWGLLKFWFRCLEQNAPWIRKIFFITWGHIPSWLNITNPKLVVVNHRDYIPEKYLPTFSSHVIELNIHRIEGLSEHFIYSNDDVFLTAPTEPTDFFRNGLPCDSAIINPIAPANRNCISNLQLTTAAVINENFKKKQVIRQDPFKWFNFKYGKLLPLNMMFLPWGRFPGLLEKHVMSSFCKSTFQEVWDKEYDLLDATCQHKFRDFKTDVNQWIMKEWQIASGNFAPRSISSGKLFSVYGYEDAIKVAKEITRKRIKMLCINDHIETIDQNTERAMYCITNAFLKAYPEKSSFER